MNVVEQEKKGIRISRGETLEKYKYEKKADSAFDHIPKLLATHTNEIFNSPSEMQNPHKCFLTPTTHSHMNPKGASQGTSRKKKGTKENR